MHDPQDNRPDDGPGTVSGESFSALLAKALSGLSDASMPTPAPSRPADGTPTGPRRGLVHRLLARRAARKEAPAVTVPDPPQAAEAPPCGDTEGLLRHVLAALVVEPPPVAIAEAPPPPRDGRAMAELIDVATPEDAGTLDLPARLDALGKLLQRPENDFSAQDLLHACWPHGSSGVRSRALLAVAINLGRNFGQPGRLPVATAKAWKMLDPRTFQSAMVQRLAAIADFVGTDHESDLDFGEIELIEYLFETIDPHRNMTLLTRIMGIAPLASRNVGLIRRMAPRLRSGADSPANADARADLLHWVAQHCPPALAQAARAALDDLGTGRRGAGAALPPTGH